MKVKLDAREIADRIGVPLDIWAGNCHGISEEIVKQDALRSLGGADTTYAVVRGHWVGPVAERSFFNMMRGQPFVPHSWIQVRGLVLPETYRMPVRSWPYPPGDPPSTLQVVYDPVIDPTRFAFDGEDPYVYAGTSDYYDAGGNRWRRMTESEVPPFSPLDKKVRLVLPVETEQWIFFQAEDQGHPWRVYTAPLCMWLANLSLDRLGEHREAMFDDCPPCQRELNESIGHDPGPCEAPFFLEGVCVSCGQGSMYHGMVKR